MVVFFDFGVAALVVVFLVDDDRMLGLGLGLAERYCGLLTSHP